MPLGPGGPPPFPTPAEEGPPRHRGRSAFTLVELLVVVGIIGILMSLLFPAITSSVRRTRALQCRSNQRQIVEAMMVYAHQ